LSILGVLIVPTFTYYTTTKYNVFKNYNEILTMSTENQTLVGGIEMDYGSPDLPKGHTVDDYFRVQFFSVEMIEGKQEIKWHGAVRCNEKYSDKVLEGTDGRSGELEDDLWICPDVDEFSVQNNPANFRTGNGTSFNLVVNSCSSA